MEGWDGVTYVIFAAERQCPSEDYQGRLEVARQAIGELWRAFDLHDPACSTGSSESMDLYSKRAMNFLTSLRALLWVVGCSALYQSTQ